MLRSVADYIAADDAGQKHVQRFLKNAGGTGDLQWQDWSFASGQPAYDARIGAALAFTPAVASRNDAIYFPPAPGLERRLTMVDMVTVAGGAGQTNVEFKLYDLIGYYPLIDGDSTDPQPMDNTLPLPRYADGDGVRAVLVNHVAPAILAADMLVSYTDTLENPQSVTWATTTYGPGKVAYTAGTGGSAAPLYASMSGGSRGITRIDEVQFTTAPGGLWCIYLVKPLGTFANRAGTNSATAVKDFLTEGLAPLILDGAWLGFFYMTNGSNRTATINGTMTFMWG